METAIRNPLPLTALSEQIGRLKKSQLALDFFEKPRTSPDNQLEIIRRWNSHSPMLTDSYGGGYFIRWRGKGIVIDPGCTFLRAFRRQHRHMRRHRMSDIDMVVVTHDHVDHFEDLSMLLVLLSQYNKRWAAKDETGITKPAHMIDLVVSHGAYFRSHSYVEHVKNRDAVKVTKVLAARPITVDHDGHDFSSYHLDMECLTTVHQEILGESTGFGLKITFKHDDGQTIVFCDSGDTAYDSGLSTQYAGANILLLHVGTLEADVNDPKANRGQHLCYDGVVKILNELKVKGALPELILLGEWGEEFARPYFRADFTHHVKEGAGLQKHAILPVDLGMKIRLEDRSVYCSDARGYLPAGQVVISDISGQDIQYLKVAP